MLRFFVAQLVSMAVAAAPPLDFTVVYRANESVANTCYRIPTLTHSRGVLLAFCEERFGWQTCGDNGVGHNLVLKRSMDGGRSWSNLSRVVGDASNLRPGGTIWGNPTPVALHDGTLLLHFCSGNNPSISAHGSTFQIMSHDTGLTWSKPVNISRFLSAKYPGALPGPTTGLQLSSGRIVMCAWATNSTIPFPAKGWQNDTNFATLLYFSDDLGQSWQMAGAAVETTNECTFSELPDKRLLLFGRAQTIPISYTIFDADLSKRTALRSVKGLPSPVCEGSLVSGLGEGAGQQFFSNPSNRHWRGNLSIHTSSDGVHWSSGYEVWGASTGHYTNSGYSALVARADWPDKLGLLFEGGESPSLQSWPDTWIRYANVSYRAILEHHQVPVPALVATQWTVFELEFQSSMHLPDPFALDAGFVVSFTSEDGPGPSMRVRGFFDGGSMWRARWSAPSPGAWTWRTECLPRSKGDSGLCGRTGAVSVRAPALNESNPLRRYGGFLKVRSRVGNETQGSARPVLTHTDGTPFFWLADTWWRAPSMFMSPADFTAAAQQRKDQGYTVIQMHGSAGFWPVACAHGASRDCTGVNCTQAIELLNVSFFQREDPYYEVAERLGLLLAVGRSIGDKLAQAPNAKAVLPKLFTYMVARWGAFPVSFLFTQEYNVLYYGPTNVRLLMDQGRVVQEADPWQRALTMHPAWLLKDTRDAWTEDWYTFVMVQEGHLTTTSGSSKTLLRSVYQAAAAQDPPMPSVNGEANYEGFWRNLTRAATNKTTGYLNCSERVDAACVRDSAWVTMQSGFAGFTYGAQGLYYCLQNASKPGPTATHGPVLTWAQGLALPGGAQLQHMRHFFEQVVGSWWLFTPSPPFSSDSFVTFAPTLPAFVVYVRPQQLSCSANSTLTTINMSGLPTQWRGIWFDPRTGERDGVFAAAVVPGTGDLAVPQRAGSLCKADWALWLSPAPQPHVAHA